jgi:hypothetical protein
MTDSTLELELSGNTDIALLSEDDWKQGQQVMRRFVDDKRQRMIRIMELQEKISMIDNTIDTYSQIWAEMYQKYNLMCDLQHNLQTQSSTSSLDRLRNALPGMIMRTMYIPGITTLNINEESASLAPEYFHLWNQFLPIRKDIRDCMEDKITYTNEINSHYEQLEKYKEYFRDIVPRSSTTLYCATCNESDKQFMSFNPCGHVLCVDCAPRLENCHMCRKKIKSRMSLYL